MLVKTSFSDPIRVDWIAGLDGPGAIGLTIAPGRRGPNLAGVIEWQRDLETDLLRLRDVQGAAMLVTLMEPWELERYVVGNVQEQAHKLGLETLTLAIRDGYTPGGALGLTSVLRRAREVVDAGHRVVVHCLGGLGRSGLVVGCFLREMGWSAPDALAALQKARGPRCPETPCQIAFVEWWPPPQ